MVEPADISTAVRGVGDAAVLAGAQVRLVTHAMMMMRLVARTASAPSSMLRRGPYAGVDAGFAAFCGGGEEGK